MKLLLRSLLFTFFALTLTNVTTFSQTATLTSDQADYAPGTTATFTGSGFQAGEIITMLVLHYDGTSDGGAEHQPWEVIADADGNL